MIAQLKLLFWKQRINLRADLSFIVATVILPSVLLFLASTNSGTITTSAKSKEIIECKIDNFLYCNYPMTIDVDSSIQEEYDDNENNIKSTFEEAMSNVAIELGSDFDSMFKTENYDGSSTTKDAGQVRIETLESASVFWYNGENEVFAETFINLANLDLEQAENPIRFEEAQNPYEYEPGSGFDLRVGTFLLILRAVGNQISQERSNGMYHYTTRSGLLPSVFWIFQYIWWMIVASISIGITVLTTLILGMDIDVGAYFVSAWWHIAFAILLSTIFKEKKYFNLATIFVLIAGFLLPFILEMSLPKTQQSEEIIDGIGCIPLFYVMSKSVSSFQYQVGCIMTAIMMLVSAYLIPLVCVNEGYHTDGKINFLYFLSSNFWKEGIVALPDHDLSTTANRQEEATTLSFTNCVKKFVHKRKCFSEQSGEEKVIGPMNLNIEIGKITTLLGQNGVGKSTLLKVAAGYYIPSEGEIFLEGVNIFRDQPWSCLKSISFCPQDNILYENMTVEEHLLLITSLRDMTAVNNVEDHIEWLLSTLDIAAKKKTLTKNLSGGMKRRLCLAMAVAGFPKFILCDEPSSGVDSINQRGIWKLLETAKNTSAIILTTHAPLEAAILSDSIVWMESSENISHDNGMEKMVFSVKNEVENSTADYDISPHNAVDVANVIASLPRSNREWKIASKCLNSGPLPSLEKLLTHEEDTLIENDDQSLLVEVDSIPESLSCSAPSFCSQVLIIMSTMLMHPDRIFFLIFFGLPLNGGMIFLAVKYGDFDELGQAIVTPLIPMIAIIASSIITIQLTEIFSKERDLGITKLLMGQGISRSAYILAYTGIYFLMSFPVSVGFMMYIGLSSYGTSTSVSALFFLYLSFFYMLMGVCCVLGSVLDANIALTATFILPSLFGIYGQGSTSQTFANMYPGSLGQIMAGLLIDDVSKSEWSLYAITMLVNLVLGSLCMYVFLLRMGNTSSLVCNGCVGKGENAGFDVPDIETALVPQKDVLLEGQSIVKTYTVGEKSGESFRALDNVTFAIEEGSLLGLVGKSGAGKSTLMDILSGQLSVSSGTVFVEGENTKPTEISKVVSMCGQLDTVWPTVKVISAIRTFSKCRGHHVPLCSKILDPYILYLIDRLALKETLNKQVKTLSGGQKRKLAFLFSLLGNTKVVLVDEAMTGVDIGTRQIMWKVLQDEIKFRGRSVVVTSHDLGEVEKYCNTIGILHNGKLAEMGRLDDIKKKWGDSVKLICLIDLRSTATSIERSIMKKNSSVIIENAHFDILNEANDSRIVVTFDINLIDINNITGLMNVMNDDHSLQENVFYWSIEPQSLDDFVRSKSGSRATLD